MDTMKHTTSITINYEVFIEAKKRYKNFSGRIEELVKADLSLDKKEPKNLEEAREMLKRHEVAVSAIKAKVENLEQKKKNEKPTMVIGGEIGEEPKYI